MYRDRTSDIASRRDLEQQGMRVAPYVTLEEFKRAWIKHHGSPQNESEKQFLENGIRMFWGDYITSDAGSLKEYFKDISRP